MMKFPNSKTTFFKTIDSTNEEAKRLISKDLKKELNGTLIIAESQSKGRGTKGASWFSPAGMGVYASLILYPKIPVKELADLPLKIIEGIRDFFKPKIKGFEVRVKKPNDLYIEDKKVAGILLESSSEKEKVKYLIVGIGINFHKPKETIPEDLKEKIGFLDEYFKFNDKLKIFYELIEKLSAIFYQQ